MIRELSVQEQKYHAVLAVLVEGRSVAEVAAQWGVSRQSVHAWLRRDEEAGLPGLVLRSTRPGSCPHQMPGSVLHRHRQRRELYRTRDDARSWHLIDPPGA